MMNIELMVLNDGGVILAGSEPFPHIVKRVEYYSEQRMIMVVYKPQDVDDDMMQYEVPMEMVDGVVKSPNIIIYSMFPDHPPIGYKAPLVKVGELY
ncbi:MAG: hypothetical protein GW778_06235 [Alphaproteobacteria bacterium]|nr:hypothetical protein [Alphaproteobacteria bacterium]